MEKTKYCLTEKLLFPPFLSNIGHNQSASRIIALTFLTKNVSNECAFFVQRAHPYQTFLRNHIRTNFRVFLRFSQCLQFREFLISHSAYKAQSSFGSHSASSSEFSFGSHGAQSSYSFFISPTAPTSTTCTPSGESLYWFS